MSKAQRTYNESLKALRAAEMGSDLVAYEAAYEAHKKNRAILVAEEIAAGPSRFEREWIRQANRGIMF